MVEPSPPSLALDAEAGAKGAAAVLHMEVGVVKRCAYRDA